jgi:hypothetical protein
MYYRKNEKKESKIDIISSKINELNEKKRAFEHLNGKFPDGYNWILQNEGDFHFQNLVSVGKESMDILRQDVSLRIDILEAEINEMLK